MTDAEFEAQRERLQKLSERWLEPLGLKWWHVTLTYERDSGEYKVDGEPSPRSIANCAADWRYLNANITWNMLQVAEQDDEELELAFVHELMHVFLNEFRALHGDGATHGVERDDWLAHEERIASTLARAFVWVRERAGAGTDDITAISTITANVNGVSASA